MVMPACDIRRIVLKKNTITFLLLVRLIFFKISSLCVNLPPNFGHQRNWHTAEQNELLLCRATRESSCAAKSKLQAEILSYWSSSSKGYIIDATHMK
jgi:hypothetical protein